MDIIKKFPYFAFLRNGNLKKIINMVKHILMIGLDGFGFFETAVFALQKTAVYRFTVSLT